MTAIVVQTLPEGEEWLYEVKLDGYRALIIKHGEKVQIRSRHEKDLTAAYPTVAAAGLRLNANTAVIDGEIVTIDAKGHPSFQALQHRAAYPQHTVVFYAFDLLHLNGNDLTRLPLEVRNVPLRICQTARPHTGAAASRRTDEGDAMAQAETCCPDSVCGVDG